VLGQFKGQELGQVSGLLNLLRQLGGSVGIALIATLLDRNNHQNYSDLVSHVSMLNPNTQAFVQQTQGGMMAKLSDQIGMALPNSATLQALTYKIQNQVFMMSFTQMMWVVMIIFGFSFIPLAMLKVDKVSGPIDAH
jgi:DHA2 family multidrug resistance protein